ncbi:aspergillopepsin-2 precursor, putative [Talaromyces stipitatus ATCC 10500]|uniref:Aspergillopepsin-2, putative n=1 Tax=Talaromyces stipitatus (strain ATCC 10500 / CBS 375.48 / QM 6759 / NRRL 1006) TaxID=441959 RepID=B8LXX2_TALSN|nr:aspergillopepsin-2 precursor, putative [Talaromyces stipitatus ATCC 10500]EED22787.1 aspergillopepsin-2 precursor, putative [Talaromyces stipitatus ATCC 10500]
MKFATTASALLLAGSAVASPLAQRVARRNRNGVSRPNARLTATNEKDDSQSTNWSGAVLVDSGFTKVSASAVAPTPSIPSGGDDSTQYCASAWVGIDGDTCQSALLQTGFDFCIQGGSVTYDAWYEWIPDNAYDFSGIDISAGDTIEMSVEATSTTSGVAKITNQSNGQSVSHTFTSSEVQSSLCQTNAEWIVEDFTIISGGSQSLAPFPAFDTVTFTDATATKGGSSIIDLVDQNNNVVTTASASGNQVVVTYQ